MKTFELIEQDNAIGHNDPRNTKYFVDGKRVTQAEFREIKSRAIGPWPNHTWNSGGIRNFQSFVTVEN